MSHGKHQKHLGFCFASVLLASRVTWTLDTDRTEEAGQTGLDTERTEAGQTGLDIKRTEGGQTGLDTKRTEEAVLDKQQTE